MSNNPFKAVLVGCGNMGKGQARTLSNHPDFTLTAVSDIFPEAADAAAKEFGVTAYGDFQEMLKKEKPDVVAICTINTSHAELTIQAAEAGVKGIYCEKPMATTMKDAVTMVERCREKGTVLVVNHQRRLDGDLQEAKRLIDSGAIGEPLVFRAYCQGDVLSDGTHLVDSLMWLSGDNEIESVSGHIVRDLDAIREKWARMKRPEPPEGFGFRYGHPVESGAFGLIQTKAGQRLEVFVGDMIPAGYGYQEYIVEGTQGRLWRRPDQMKPDNLFLSTAEPGDHEVVRQENSLALKPAAKGGSWKKVTLAPDSVQPRGLIGTSYSLFAESIRKGTPHPMSGEIALRAFPAVLGIFESARRNSRVYPPFKADRFPLELIIENSDS